MSGLGGIPEGISRAFTNYVQGTQGQPKTGGPEAGGTESAKLSKMSLLPPPLFKAEAGQKLSTLKQIANVAGLFGAFTIGLPSLMGHSATMAGINCMIKNQNKLVDKMVFSEKVKTSLQDKIEKYDQMIGSVKAEKESNKNELNELSKQMREILRSKNFGNHGDYDNKEKIAELNTAIRSIEGRNAGLDNTLSQLEQQQQVNTDAMKILEEKMKGYEKKLNISSEKTEVKEPSTEPEIEVKDPELEKRDFIIKKLKERITDITKGLEDPETSNYDKDRLGDDLFATVRYLSEAQLNRDAYIDKQKNSGSV